MKTLSVIFALAVSISAMAQGTMTNTVITIDQDGNVNKTNVLADAGQMAANAVKVEIAAQAATAAAQAAVEGSNTINAIAANIVANEVRIYRKGSMSAFEALALYDENDKVYISGIEINKPKGYNSISYVSTVDWGSVKPIVRTINTLSDRADFVEVDDSAVSAPVEQTGSFNYHGDTFNKQWTITVPKLDWQHFYYIDLDADAPEGTGATLDVKGGFTGGFTGDIIEGNIIKTYKGGLLMEVRNVD